jgi:hypothetical protein
MKLTTFWGSVKGFGSKKWKNRKMDEYSSFLKKYRIFGKTGFFCKFRKFRENLKIPGISGNPGDAPHGPIIPVIHIFSTKFGKLG